MGFATAEKLQFKARNSGVQTPGEKAKPQRPAAAAAAIGRKEKRKSLDWKEEKEKKLTKEKEKRNK